MITTIISCLTVVAIMLLTAKINDLNSRLNRKSVDITSLWNRSREIHDRVDTLHEGNRKRDSDITELRRLIVETITEDCPLEDMVEGIEIRSLANYEQIKLLMDHLKLKVVEEKLTIKKK